MIAIVLMCLATYGTCATHEFMIDDYSYVKTSSQGELFTDPGHFLYTTTNQHFEPLNKLINGTLFRASPQPGPLYCLNVIFLIIMALTLTELIFELSENNLLAFIVGSLFVLHPMTASIVNHISLNVVIICAALLTRSLGLLNKSIKNNTRYALPLSYIFFAIGLLTQENIAVSFPIYVFIFLKAYKGFSLKTAYNKTLGYILLTLIHLNLWAITHWARNSAIENIASDHLSIFSVFKSLAGLIFWYIANLVWPQNIIFMVNAPLQQIDNSRIATTLLFFAVAVIFTVIFYKKYCKTPVRKFASLLFISGFIFFLPASLTRPHLGLTLQPYWFFFSTIGFFILAGEGLLSLKTRLTPLIFRTLVAGIFILLFMDCQRINLYASTEFRYAYYWLKENPQNPIPKMMLATIYLENPKMTIPNELIPAMEELGSFYAKTNKSEVALALTEKLLSSATDPKPRILYNFQKAALLLRLKEQSRAESLIQDILSSKLNSQDCVTFSYTLADFGMPEDALSILEGCIQNFPEDPNAYLLKGIILSNKNQILSAVNSWREGFRQAPEDPRFQEFISQAMHEHPELKNF